jgi:hypothetical protein
LVISGISEVSNFINKSNKFSFSAIVTKESTIDVPVFDFPDWEVKVNGKIYNHNPGVIGRIEIKLPPGNYSVVGSFKNTPIRAFADSLTIMSVVLFGIYIIYGKNRKIFK